MADRTPNELADELEAHARWDEEPPFTPPRRFAADLRAAAVLLRVQGEQLDTLRNELAQFSVDEPCNCGWGGVHDPDNLNCNRTQAVLAAAGAAPYPEEGATDEQ